MRDGWAGVDVGGERKGFHAALLRPDGRVECHESRDPRGLARWLFGDGAPRVVAVDSPCTAAPTGATRRACEQQFADRRVCGIRWTPDQATLGDSLRGYYGWVNNGQRLYRALADVATSLGSVIVECFPTATLTRIGGPRGGRPRAAWSRDHLQRWGLLDGRSNQDQRDALVAAVTAWLHDQSGPHTETLAGELVIPAVDATWDAVRALDPPWLP